jgi:purine-binding chemotaxis protein CheW
MSKHSEQENPKLPPSGLADDVLQNKDVTNTKWVSEPEVSQKAKDIYDFTDQLKQGGNGGEEGKEEERIETWVTFALGNEFFGLPVSSVKEILRAGSITRVPHAPTPVRGVTNMRGKVLPVVDLNVRLGLKESGTGSLSRILVVESKGRLIGLLVDSVQQVFRMNLKAIQPPPPDIMTTQSDYILGVYHLQDVLVILLDVDRVLFIKDSLQKAAVAGAR